MDLDTWWDLIGRARDAAGDRADDRDPVDDPLPGALVDVLAALEPPRIADFAVRLVQVRDTAYLGPLWKAAYLIEGGCGDDGFQDFRDGLILLGREVFTRAVADPDSLAQVPLVVRMAREERGWLGYESLSYLAQDAYLRVLGETGSFTAVLDGAVSAMELRARPAGDDWDSEDDAEQRRRLPGLGGRCV
ncbi:DUF4240 domain-containing protein [Actinosynnema sp. NPDC020468]|uniref:DUF4240 domain-containing protein n=1 Tax=Actinosynnema sp. NPDC020468 TaxID=3154488 RepID=UPI0033FA2C30